MIEIKCLVSEVHLNHPETIPPTLPGPWKNCLPRNQKGWGPLARRRATENRVVRALLIACYSEAGLLSTKLCQGDGLEPEASQVTWQVRRSSNSVPLWQDLMLSLSLSLCHPAVCESSSSCILSPKSNGLSVTFFGCTASLLL